MKLLRQISVFTIIFCTSFTAEFVSFGGEIFSMSGDARMSAMGGSNPALFGTSGQSFSNPALVHIVSDNSVSFTYRSQYSGLADFHIFSTPVKFFSNENASLGIFHRSVKDIPYTNDAFELVGGYPNPIDYDLITTFDHTELAAILSMAGEVNNYQIGVNVKTLLYSIYTEKAFGIGLDIGGIRELNKHTLLGIMMHDIPFTGIKWSTGQTELIPMGLSAGLTHTREKWLFTGMMKTDQLLNYSVSNKGSLGFEYDLSPFFSLRAGMQMQNTAASSFQSSYSVGMGVNQSPFNIDYAYITSPSESPFKSSHEFTIGIDMEEFHKLSDIINP